MEFSLNKDLKYSIYDGIFANMFATLTGGVFLTGFAIHLGMDEFMIGLLGSMPFLATVFQMPASYWIEKKGRRKEIAYRSAALARTVWIPVVIVFILPFPPLSAKTSIVLLLLFISYVFITISYVSWLSWISDLVSDDIRGSFFGTRNMLNGAAGMVVMVSFGYLLDYLKRYTDWGVSIGFCVTFLTAVLFGLLSLSFLRRISEIPNKGIQHDMPFRKRLSIPFKDSNFGKFLIYTTMWSFSVYFASPFFTLYFFRTLKFSYGFVATLGTISAFADMLGMQVWGRISDRFRNKAVIQAASWVAVFLPLAWVMVKPGSVIIPILLHILGGGFWAGVNLCVNNLLIRITPKENKPVFLSTYSIFAGLGAALSPVLAGFIIRSLGEFDMHVLSWQILPLHLIFVTSTLLRILSLQFFRYIHEPEEVSVGQMVRVLRSVRGLNVANGFNHLLHPFIEIAKETFDRPK
jgi:Na+/melibiose symporter-like transporter